MILFMLFLVTTPTKETRKPSLYSPLPEIESPLLADTNSGVSEFIELNSLREIATKR
jgi:hypothetical protein